MTEAGQLSAKTVHSNYFIGHNLLDSKGETLGKISDIIIDKENGKVVYLVVPSGGILGMGGESRVVPFMALKTDAEGRLSLAIDKDRFSQAPTLTDNLDDHQWGARVYNFYGIAPYWEKSTGPSLHETTK